MTRTSAMLVLLVLAMLTPSACDSRTDQNKPASRPQKRIQLGMIPRGSTGPWKAMKAAAVKTATALEVNLVWQEPAVDFSAGAQLRAMDDLMAQQVDAILIAPQAPLQMMASIADVSRKVPIILFETPADSDYPSAMVYSDGGRVGKLAAEQIAKLLGNSGTVAMIRANNPSATRFQCEEVFRSEVMGMGRVDLSGEPSAPDDPKSVAPVAVKLLNRARKISCLFGPGERCSVGILDALEDTALAGEVKFVGVGMDAALLRGLDRGAIHVLIIDDMPKIGELAIRAAVGRVRKQTTAKIQPVEPLVLTSQNRNDPAMRLILGTAP